MESVTLICMQTISHLLKFFCFCDGKPFPYEKWLYQVGLETTLGSRTRRYVEAIMADIRLDHVVYEKPTAYVDPGHRNEKFENYRLYHLFELLFQEIHDFRVERFPVEVR